MGKLNSLSKKAKGAFEKPRKDIEMDVLLEILKGERFITVIHMFKARLICL